MSHDVVAGAGVQAAVPPTTAVGGDGPYERIELTNMRKVSATW